MDAHVQRVAAALESPSRARWFRAPGRVNLMGDHTDYNDGYVLPMAIQLECVIAATPADEVRVRSLDDADAERFVAAVVEALAERGRPPVGIDAVLSSTIPIGSGLSSSAAFEVACALALSDAAGWRLEPRELALACQRAEQLATGVPSGAMDQLASLLGQEGNALLIDCRSLEVEPVPIPPGIVVLAVHSGLPRTLAGSAYAERRAACERIAAELGVAALRDARLDQVADEPLARHVVTENARVHATADALRTGDAARAAHLFAESHVSLRDDYRVSTPELDALTEELVLAGALGARLTGAGFGGCVVALVEADALDDVLDRALPAYRERTGREPVAYPCRAVAGAGPL